MRRPKPTINNRTVEMSTYTGKERVRFYEAAANNCRDDPKKKERREAQQCVLCFYVKGRIGGNVGTYSECGNCGTELQCGNTNIDVLCKPCAKSLGLCVHCGADIDLKHRRKKREFRQ